MNINAIHAAVAAIDRQSIMLARQKRLAMLVKKYGRDEVAAAMGLKPSTVRQNLYTRKPEIGLDPLEQAQAILEKLSSE